MKYFIIHNPFNSCKIKSHNFKNKPKICLGVLIPTLSTSCQDDFMGKCITWRIAFRFSKLFSIQWHPKYKTNEETKMKQRYEEWQIFHLPGSHHKTWFLSVYLFSLEFETSAINYFLNSICMHVIPNYIYLSSNIFVNNIYWKKVK